MRDMKMATLQAIEIERRMVSQVDAAESIVARSDLVIGLDNVLLILIKHCRSSLSGGK